MRIRFVLALVVAGMLFAAGVASAQDTTTQPLSDYGSTTPTVTTPKTTTTTTKTSTPAVKGESSSGVAPAVAAGTAPSGLAFTGAEPLLLIVFGLGMAGGTTALLVRDRRRSNQGR